jgi:hypothetical protein
MSALLALAASAEPRKVFGAEVRTTAVRVSPAALSSIRIVSDPRGAGRLHYGPTEATVMEYGWLEPGESVTDFGHWPQLWLKTAWSRATATVWSGVGFAQKTERPTMCTTEKGGSIVTLANDGTVSQVSTTVNGGANLTISQDPRNDPATLIWCSTHIIFGPDQHKGGKPLPGSGPPIRENHFPLWYGQTDRMDDFNGAVWCWMEPGQDVGTTRVFYRKHACG